MIKIEKLNPFGRMCISLGMLPSSYKESLTYEEQLLWFMDYLQNQVIPAVNNNADALIELQNYVSQYFDNLDVQEEINNKLDEMAESGQLQAIIKSYVDPLYQSYVDEVNGIISGQNTEISSFKSDINSEISSFESSVNSDLEEINNKVDSATSGSPLVASSTSGMTDTTRIYVNTTDGHWYYYNGSTWTDGGTYQSTQIANNSIYYNMLENALQNNIDINDLTIPNIVTNNTYYDGSIGSTISIDTSGTTFSSGYINVNTNDIIISDWFCAHDYGIVYPLIFTDENDIIIEKYDRSYFYNTTTKRPKKFIYKVPSNIKKMYFNTRNNVPWYPSIVKGYNYIDDRLNSQLLNESTVTPSSTIANKLYSLYYWNSDQNNYVTNVYSVNNGDKMNINMELYPNAHAVPGIFLDENLKPIAYIEGENNTQGWVTINKDFIVPYNAKYLYSSGHVNRPTTVKKYTFSDVDLTEKKKVTVNYTSGTLLITNNSNGNTLTMKHSTTGNELFEIVGYKVGGTSKSFETDMIPSPYIVKAINNANGDRQTDGFTGGQHRYSNNEYDGTKTAEEISLSIYVDNRDITSEASISVQGNEVKIVEVNRVQATNTCLAAGGGRNVLEERIVFTYDGRKLDVVNTITPLEDINLIRYYGIQTASFSDSDYKVYADKVYDVSSQLQCPEKPKAIYGSNLISSYLYDEGLGDYSLNSVSRKVNISSGKSYYVPVSTETANNISSGSVQYIHGCYIFDYIQK